MAFLRRAAVCLYEHRGQSLPVDDQGVPLHGILRYDTNSNVAPFSVPRVHKVVVSPCNQAVRVAAKRGRGVTI